MAQPSLAVLDNFNRANGGLGSNWTTGLYFGTAAPQISSNQVAGNVSYAEAYWNPITPGPDTEVFLTIATPPATNEIVYLWARGQSPGTSGAADAYELVVTRLSGTDSWELNRVINETPTNIATRSQEVSAGDAMGLVVLGTGATVTIQIWYRPSGGSWTQLGADVSDTNAARITAAGRIGAGSNSATCRWDDFGGGTQVSGSTISFAMAPASTSSTPDTAVASVLRPLAAAAASASSTPDTALIGVPVDMIFIAASVSTSPNAVLAADRALAFARTSASATPGNAWLVPGPYALRFYGHTSGQIDRVRIPLDTGSVSTPADVGAGDFTIEFWLRCTYAANTSTSIADARYSNIVLDRDIYGHQRGWVCGVTRRSGPILAICFGVAGASLDWVTIYGTTNIGDDAWHHVAIVRRQSTGAIELYVDGALDANGTYTTGDLSYPDGYDPGQGQDNPYLVLGTEKHDVGGGTAGYVGLLDELRISNTRRYTSDFTRPSGPFVPDASTQALYHSDHGSGTLLGDSAQVSGAPTNGDLLVGGSPIPGPAWEAATPFSTISFAIALTSASSTPDDVEPNVVRAIALAASSAASTPDNAALLVLKALALAAASQSSSPDTIAMLIEHALTLAPASLSSAPDTAVLAGLRPVAFAAASLSSTPDTATLSVPGSGDLAFTVNSQSSVADSITLAVLRLPPLGVVSTSTTPDAALGLLIALAVAAASASISPDAALAVSKALGFSVAALSDTPANAVLRLDRSIALARTSGSQTPNDADLVAAGAQGRLVFGITSKRPRIQIAVLSIEEN